ncbi:olfactory receptor 1L4-like [Petaurus breviceps papuanus]|uniref:olfactory receptor 1L4-like n=1 Tax=Petaurus breviceps papuanus TaxID=3040969 RepID=UPI0036DCC2B2
MPQPFLAPGEKADHTPKFPGPKVHTAMTSNFVLTPVKETNLRSLKRSGEQVIWEFGYLSECLVIQASEVIHNIRINQQGNDGPSDVFPEIVSPYDLTPQRKNLISICEYMASTPGHPDTLEEKNDNSSWGSGSTSGFILLGLSSNPQLQKPLFAIFLGMYLVTLLGNLLIIMVIRSNSTLHTPMYFFLSILSFTDICFTSVIVPKMLVNFLSETKAISYIGCLVQMYFFMAFGNTDSYLLASMAIDRLVAICNPLQYAMVMSHRRCVTLAVASCVISHLHALLRVLLMSRLSFCASHIIKHFFCDTQPVLKLSCSDTSSSQVVVMTETLAVIVTPFLCIIFSYLRIIAAILKVPSASGKWKTFSTCGSHLTIVVLFYGSIIYVYFRPLSSYSVVKDRVATVMYTVVTPMLNPFIYSLRNKDMKQGLGKLRDRIRF